MVLPLKDYCIVSKKVLKDPKLEKAFKLRTTTVNLCEQSLCVFLLSSQLMAFLRGKL